MGDAAHEIKIFTLAEANDLLPHLTAKLERIRSLMGEARAVQRQLRMFQAVGHDRNGVLIMAHDYRKSRTKFEAIVQEVERIVEEIEALGCCVRNVELGVVDFPGTYAGRTLMFCWRLGEPEIGHYHRWGEGFAARRPLFSYDDTIG